MVIFFGPSHRFRPDLLDTDFLFLVVEILFRFLYVIVNMYENTITFLHIKSLSKKDKYTKKIEDLNYHHSHCDGKTMWSHCVVTSYCIWRNETAVFCRRFL
jgi:hypothetical protein